MGTFCIKLLLYYSLFAAFVEIGRLLTAAAVYGRFGLTGRVAFNWTWGDSCALMLKGVIESGKLICSLWDAGRILDHVGRIGD